MIWDKVLLYKSNISTNNRKVCHGWLPLFIIIWAFQTWNKPEMVINLVPIMSQKSSYPSLKTSKFSALARALLYKVDPCEYQSPGIGMHLSDVATMGEYFYQTDWLIASDCESWVKLIQISPLNYHEGKKLLSWLKKIELWKILKRDVKKRVIILIVVRGWVKSNKLSQWEPIFKKDSLYDVSIWPSALNRA